ncbi:Phosphodiesterase YfcE [Sporomusa ovata DSM 2662]|uniref:Phosphoesterase n=1 Tax=Sporomusa ovata TaxID=2378 RepID=A0A0U1L4D0_9FIRM|nr:phosphodiesterase [Sporomusa ovata]EQB25985.1 phosphodiesterase YfcE [Sporomusa ovata DSM 2662]CQR74562.1 phosphodiesterase, MJ0936 family [Sporomusa ovata]
MKIGIISDTHGCLETWEQVFHAYFQDSDLIIHAGDVLYHGPRNAIPAEYNPKQLAEVLNNCPVPIVTACGNCDAEVDSMVLTLPIQSPYSYLLLNGLRIVVTHGHNLTDDAKRELAERLKANIFITGHTHIATLEKLDGIIYLNPGSPGMTKRPDGHGTIAWINDNKVEILEIATGQPLISEILA